MTNSNLKELEETFATKTCTRKFQDDRLTHWKVTKIEEEGFLNYFLSTFFNIKHYQESLISSCVFSQMQSMIVQITWLTCCLRKFSVIKISNVSLTIELAFRIVRKSDCMQVIGEMKNEFTGELELYTSPQ